MKLMVLVTQNSKIRGQIQMTEILVVFLLNSSSRPSSEPAHRRKKNNFVDNSIWCFLGFLSDFIFYGVWGFLNSIYFPPCPPPKCLAGNVFLPGGAHCSHSRSLQKSSIWQNAATYLEKELLSWGYILGEKRREKKRAHRLYYSLAMESSRARRWQQGGDYSSMKEKSLISPCF